MTSARANAAMIAIAAVMAGCDSSPSTTPDAPVVEPTCVATFTGNFAESSTSPANCPSRDADSLSLSFSIASQTLGTSLAITMEVGAIPLAGRYTPETVVQWNARAAQKIGVGVCLYSAGSDVVPHGDFLLDIDPVTTTGVHGTVVVTVAVLQFPDTDCGDDDTESLQVAF